MSNPSDIAIQFAVKGVDEVLHALRSIEEAALASSSRTLQKETAARNTANAARVKSARSGADNEGKAREAAAQAHEKRIAAMKDRAATAAGTAAKRATDAEIAAAKKATDTIAAMKTRSATEMGKLAKRAADVEIAERKRAAAQQARTTQALAREESRAVRAAVRDRITPGRNPLSPLSPTGPHARLALIQDARNRSPEEQRAVLGRVRDMAGYHQIYQTAHDRETRENELALNERHQRVTDSVMRGTTSAARMTINAGRRVTSAFLDVGGGFSVEGAIKERAEEERAAALLANKAPGGTRPTKEVLDKSRAIGIRTGYAGKDIIDAWTAYIDKAGADTKEQFDAGGINAEFFAKYAKATDTDISQVANVAGQLRDANVGLGPEQMKQTLLDVLQQGRSGSVDIPELIGSLKSYTKSAPYYAHDQTDTQRILMGMAQVVSPTGSPREGATALTNLSGDAVKHSADVEAFMGKGYFNEQHQLTKTADVFIGDILEKTHGDVEKIQSMGSGKTVFGKIAQRAFMASLVPYNQAKQEALANGATEDEANKAGRKAYDKFVQGKIGKSYSEANLNKDFANVMNSDAERFAATVRELKQVVATDGLPALRQLLPIFRDLAGPLRDVLHAAADLANWLRNHPLEGAFLLAGASILKEITASIVSAKIGDVVKNLIANSASGGTLPVPGAGAGSIPGAGNAPGATTASGSKGGSLALGGALLSAYKVLEVGDEVITSIREGHDAGMKINEDMASGDPKRVAEAQAAIAKAQGQNTTRRQGEAYENTAGTVLEWLYNPASAAGNAIGDMAMRKATGKATAGDRRNETFAAGSLLDTVMSAPKDGALAGNVVLPTKADPESIKATEDNTAAMKDLAAATREAAKNRTGGGTREPTSFVRGTPYGPADPTHPSRGSQAPGTPQRPQ